MGRGFLRAPVPDGTLAGVGTLDVIKRYNAAWNAHDLDAVCEWTATAAHTQPCVATILRAVGLLT